MKYKLSRPLTPYLTRLYGGTEASNFTSKFRHLMKKKKQRKKHTKSNKHIIFYFVAKTWWTRWVRLGCGTSEEASKAAKRSRWRFTAGKIPNHEAAGWSEEDGWWTGKDGTQKVSKIRAIFPIGQLHLSYIHHLWEIYETSLSREL